MRRWPAFALAGIVLAASPGRAGAQIFLSTRPDPAFTIGPLYVTATVTPAVADPLMLDVSWGLVIPPKRSGGDLAQDFFLIWPGAIAAPPNLGTPDPALAKYLKARGFDVIDEGRLSLSSRNLRAADGGRLPEAVPGGAPFATFVRAADALGLTPPATYIRIPWTPTLVNRGVLMNLRIPLKGGIKPQRTTWIERTFRGSRQLVSVSFNDVSHRAAFPLYLEHRDRVIRLAEEPSQLLIAFADIDHLTIEEVAPPTARRALSETLDKTQVVSSFLDSSEGLTPHILSVRFGYFTGIQSWAVVVIPLLFFSLGNMAGPILSMFIRRAGRSLSAHVWLGRHDNARVGRQQGVLLSPQTLARIVPGETTFDEVLKLGGPNGEVSEQLGADHRTLTYRGQRVEPQRRRVFAWFATVSYWNAEQHEVQIEFDRNVVSDVQARVRRSRLTHPDAA